MKKKTFNSMLLTFGITVLTIVHPVSGQMSAPTNPISMDSPVEENDINPLSDINAQRSE